MIGGVVAVALLLVVVAAVVVIPRLTGGEDERRGFGPGPTQEPEEQWATDIDKEAEIVLVADDQRVYVLEEGEVDVDSGEEAPIAVRAFAASDGEELWDTEVEGLLSQGTPILSPVGDGQVLLVDNGGGEPTTRLLDADTGEEVWEVDGEPSDGYQLFGLFGAPSVQGAEVIVFDVGGSDGADPSMAGVERHSGEELWSEKADSALPCGDVVLAVEDDDDDDDDGGDDFNATPLTAYDSGDGEELWTAEGQPGLCDGTNVALSTANDEVQVRRLSDGDEGAAIDVPDGEETWSGIPFGDRVLVQRSTLTEDEVELEVAVYQGAGDEPTWEDSDVFALPVDDDRVLTVTFGDRADQEIALIRPSDGEELGQASFPAEDNACEGAFGAQTVISCETGSADVRSFTLDSLEEQWAIDAGADVLRVAVGGDRLFVATDDGELLGFR